MSALQYPLTGRALCNPCARTSTEAHHKSCSTLTRVVSSATSGSLLSRDFSSLHDKLPMYSLRWRSQEIRAFSRRANRHCFPRQQTTARASNKDPHLCIPLAIPSLGSSPMQSSLLLENRSCHWSCSTL